MADIMEEQLDTVVNDISILVDKVNNLKDKVIDKMHDRSQYILRLERQLAQAQAERDMLLIENEKLRLKCAKFDSISTASDSKNGITA